MNKIQNNPVNEETNKEKTRYPYEFMALMISLVLGGIVIVLKIAGVFQLEETIKEKKYKP